MDASLRSEFEPDGSLLLMCELFIPLHLCP
jgi:hypothetical protein